jgi:hypothetical protein
MRAFTIPVAFTLAAVLTSLGQLDHVQAMPTKRDMALSKAAALCDQGDRQACQHLAFLTQGECASPDQIGGCRFDSLSYR